VRFLKSKITLTIIFRHKNGEKNQKIQLWQEFEEIMAKREAEKESKSFA
jgi:hypothetical protein